MMIVALLISLTIAGIGFMGVISPARLLGLMELLLTRAGIWFAAGIRLVFGVALCVAGPASASPQLVGGLGVFVIVAGLVTPLFGLQRYSRVLDWWKARGPAFLRVQGAFAAFFGLAIASLLRP
jgi:hypothetical protein